jgi:hypothetical protein
LLPKRLAQIVSALTQLIGPLLNFIEQSCVFDRDHRLVGKHRDQLDLLRCEWIDRSASQEENADGRSIPKQRYAEPGAEAPALLSLEPSELGIS